MVKLPINNQEASQLINLEITDAHRKYAQRKVEEFYQSLEKYIQETLIKEEKYIPSDEEIAKYGELKYIPLVNEFGNKVEFWWKEKLVFHGITFDSPYVTLKIV